VKGKKKGNTSTGGGRGKKRKGEPHLLPILLHLRDIGKKRKGRERVHSHPILYYLVGDWPKRGEKKKGGGKGKGKKGKKGGEKGLFLINSSQHLEGGKKKKKGGERKEEKKSI